MRKTIIYIVIAVLIILIGFLGWRLISRDESTALVDTVKNVLPFGSNNNTSVTPTTNGQELTTNNTDELAATQNSDQFGSPTTNLFRISETPVAGFVIFNQNNAPVVRYVDRGTGHIYDADLATLAKRKVTNTTLPKIYEAFFKKDGNAVLLRSLIEDSDVVENQSLILTPPKAASSSEESLYTITSTLLRGDIAAVAIGSGNNIYYALKDSSSIVSSVFNSLENKTIFSSPFTNWRMEVGGSNLYLSTKASFGVPGYLYTLNPSSGTLAKILGPLNALITKVNSSGNRVVYSYIENGVVKLAAKTIGGEGVLELSPATFAEKCVWQVKNVDTVICGSPTDLVNAGEPDNWYRGLTHFSDRIWSFDIKKETAQILAEPKSSIDVNIDLTDPQLSANEDYLVFINRNDLSLWALKLEEQI